MSFADFARAFFALAVTLGLVGLAALRSAASGRSGWCRLQRPRADRRLAHRREPAARSGPAAGAGAARRNRAAAAAGRGPHARRGRRRTGPATSPGAGRMIRLLATCFHSPTWAEVRRAALISLVATALSLIVPAVGAGPGGEHRPRHRRGPDRPGRAAGRPDHGAVAGAVDRDHDHLVRADHRGAVAAAHRRSACSRRPPNSVLISLSLFLTAIVMGPTLQASYDQGVKPLLDHKMELPAAFGAAATAGEGLHAAPGRPRRPRRCSCGSRTTPQAGQGRSTRRCRW